MLEHNRDLTDHDLAGLRDRDAVKTFFAKLGFAVERGRPTDPVAERMKEGLAKAIQHIEVIAADPDDFVAVYLIECPSVAVDRLNKLANHFKNKAGDALAVLTADDQRLDVVLLDRQLVRDGASARMTQGGAAWRMAGRSQSRSPHRVERRSCGDWAVGVRNMATLTLTQPWAAWRRG